MFSFPGSESGNYQPDEGRRHKELIHEEDHVEGLKFLAEHDMRSLHKFYSDVRDIATNCHTFLQHIPALGKEMSIDIYILMEGGVRAPKTCLFFPGTFRLKFFI
jgi:hypothetical protein